MARVRGALQAQTYTLAGSRVNGQGAVDGRLGAIAAAILVAMTRARPPMTISIMGLKTAEAGCLFRAVRRRL